MSEQFATFIDVILPLPLANQYTYRVPTAFVSAVSLGQRVAVQFGKRKVYAGLVYKIHHTPPKGYEAKYIVDVLDDAALVNEAQIQFWEWIASYYMCSLGEVMIAALPAAFRIESSTVIQLNPAFEIDAEQLSDKEFLVLEALSLHPELNMEQLSEIVQQKNVFPLLKSLYAKDAIRMSEELNATYKPKQITCVKLNEQYADETRLHELFTQLEKKATQTDALLALIQLQQQQEHVPKNKLIEYSGISASAIQTLLKKNIIVSYKLSIDRIAPVTTPLQSFELNPHQQIAYQQLKQQLLSHDIVLLHGITSSGKTHVYVKFIEEAVASGNQVLLLLPEIALTSQIVTRIQKYFGDKAISFHSKYSQNERVEIWHKIQSGDYQIVIGARSAVFLPFNKLQLVIVDEEHESSYKQQDKAPRYHARDAAMVLASIWQCKTILGSATPSFESYHHAQNNRYGLVHLNQRWGEIAMPKMLTANIAEAQRTKTMKGNFTTVLYNQIEHALAQNKQVILFQNRRGYAPVLECQQCHWTPKCQNCDIHLTYHKYNDSLKCHYCGFTLHPPKSCTACGSHALALKGIGTEKIEDELSALFPNARVARLDLDTTKSKNGHEQIIQSFENHEADILVGTQMLSKGLDFGKVILVGVVNADTLLYFPDFRANERAYQLLTQVSGRAGRKAEQGLVVIQTSQPEHHVIQEVLHQQYLQLYANELEDRKQFGYPPFYRLIKLTVKHQDYTTASEAAFFLQKALHIRLGDGIVGPESPYVSRIRNLHLKEMLIKVSRNVQSLNGIKQFIAAQIYNTLTEPAYKKVIVAIDVDPI